MTTVRSLGCGGPITTDTEPVRERGPVERDRKGSLDRRPHRCLQVAGRATLFEGLRSGGGLEGIVRGVCTGTCSAIFRWQAVRHRTQNDLGGGEGGARELWVVSRLVHGALGEAGGPPPPRVPCSGVVAAEPGPRGACLASAQRIRG